MILSYRDRLDLALKHSGKSQMELANAAGVHKQVVYDVLSANRPGRQHLAKYAKALNVPVKWLIEGAQPCPTWVEDEEVSPPHDESIMSWEAYVIAIQREVFRRSDALHKKPDEQETITMPFGTRQNAIALIGIGAFRKMALEVGVRVSELHHEFKVRYEYLQSRQRLKLLQEKWDADPSRKEATLYAIHTALSLFAAEFHSSHLNVAMVNAAWRCALDGFNDMPEWKDAVRPWNKRQILPDTGNEATPINWDESYPI